MRKIIISLLLIGFFLSCNKNDNFNEKVNNKLDLRSELDQGYTDSELNILLNTAAVSLLDYAKDRTFVQNIYDKAKEECSGDYEVLFKYINDEIDKSFKNNFISNVNTNKNEITYDSDVAQIVGNYPRQLSEENSVRDKIIDGDIKENKYFTQIFIPFLERFSNTDMPKAIVVYSLDGTSNQEPYGYEISELGEITTKMISENYAKTNLVWVISLNEVIENDSSYLDYILCKDTIDNNNNNPPSGDTLGPRDYICKEYFVNEIYLKEDLEDWPAGKSNVWCIVAFMDRLGNEVADPTLTFLKDVKEKDLNKWISLGTFPIEVTRGLDNVCCPYEVIDFIIYEKDIVKKSWAREFRPWKGVGQEWGSKTYHYYSKQNNFFSRSFPECGRWYHELPYFFSPTLDRVWNYNAYAGYSKTSAALEL